MYTITDVPELAEWMNSKVAAHPSFRPLTKEELEADVAAGLLITSSEEGQKVERNLGQVTCAFRHQMFGVQILPSWAMVVSCPDLKVLCVRFLSRAIPGLFYNSGSS